MELMYRFSPSNVSSLTFDGEKRYIHPIASLSRLLRGIKSNHNGHFYCLNYFHSTAQIISLKNMKMYVMNMIIVILKYLLKTIKH